jgi:hypothetical protein
MQLEGMQIIEFRRRQQTIGSVTMPPPVEAPKSGIER